MKNELRDTQNDIMNNANVLGLIAGAGRLPFLVANGAKKAGLKVISGGKHLKVVDSAGKFVTTIPHSPHAKPTIKAIADAIMHAAGF